MNYPTVVSREEWRNARRSLLGPPARAKNDVCGVARATVPQIERVKSRMGWRFPWYSCDGTTFHEDFVGSENARFGLSVFIRRADGIHQTYFTSGRGIEQPSNTFGLLDITPWGRQESWERSPAGWPREPAHGWLRLHDEYDAERGVQA